MIAKFNMIFLISFHDGYSHITFQDLFLTPIYGLFIAALMMASRKSLCQNKGKIIPYFFPAFLTKVLGGIILGLIYQYYYKGAGDTFVYYTSGIFMKNIIFDHSFMTYFRCLWATYETCPPDLTGIMYQLYFFQGNSTYFIVKIASFFALLSFNTFLVMTLFFSTVSFLGTWLMFRLFTDLYPELTKKGFYAIFLAPSVIMWGGGILKDSISLCCLGLFFYAFVRLFMERKFTILNWTIFVFSFYVIYIVKVYIIACFIPAAMMYLLLRYNSNIKSQMTKIILQPFMILIALGSGFMIVTKISEGTQFNVANIQQTAYATASWINYSGSMWGERSSAYTLGDYDYSITGVIKKIPLAINVSLYRPYLWECASVTMFLGGIESLFFLLATLYVVYKIGVGSVIRLLILNPFISFCLFFSLTFALAVGMTSYNFGALSRYKVPMVPFYSLFLAFMFAFLERKNNARI